MATFTLITYKLDNIEDQPKFDGFGEETTFATRAECTAAAEAWEGASELNRTTTYVGGSIAAINEKRLAALRTAVKNSDWYNV